MDLSGNGGIVDTPNLDEAPPLGLALFGRDRLVDDDVDFLAAERLPSIVGKDTRLALDVARIAISQVAEKLVGGAVGKDHDVARLAAPFGQPVHAVDERQHEGQEGDDEREGQRRQERDAPAHDQVAQVVAQRHAAHKDERQERYQGDRQVDKRLPGNVHSSRGSVALGISAWIRAVAGAWPPEKARARPGGP